VADVVVGLTSVADAAELEGWDRVEAVDEPGSGPQALIVKVAAITIVVSRLMASEGTVRRLPGNGRHPFSLAADAGSLPESAVVEVWIDPELPLAACKLD